MAYLPVEPRIGKMIIYGVIFRCLDPLLTIAAGLSYKDPFVTPLNCRQQADQVGNRLFLFNNSISKSREKALPSKRGFKESVPKNKRLYQSCLLLLLSVRLARCLLCCPDISALFSPKTKRSG